MVREAARRTLGMRHFDVQVSGIAWLGCGWNARVGWGMIELYFIDVFVLDYWWCRAS